VTIARPFRVAEDVRAALLLTGALRRVVRALPELDRANADRMLQAMSRRLFKALTQLEPQRAKLVSGCSRCP